MLPYAVNLFYRTGMQVLEEALMVLLVLQGGLSGTIHNDLSRLPAFICTALVHVLRSSILRLLDQVRSVIVRLNVVQFEGAHFKIISLALALRNTTHEQQILSLPVHVFSDVEERHMIYSSFFQ